jgi:myosin V
MAHSYDVGTRAWQPDTQEGWISSEVEGKKVQGGKVMLRFVLADGEVIDAFTDLRSGAENMVCRQKR